MDLKTQILTAIEAHVKQRPGFESGNYGDSKSWNADCSRALRDLHDALTLVRACALRSYLIADDLLQAARDSFSGRLTIEVKPMQNAGYYGVEANYISISYCTGQYYPTEFRAAACSVLGSALFSAMRRDLVETHGNEKVTGNMIRKTLRIHHGARLQRKWMD